MTSINEIRRRGFPQDLQKDRTNEMDSPGAGFVIDMEDPDNNTIVDLQDATQNKPQDNG